MKNSVLRFCLLPSLLLAAILQPLPARGGAGELYVVVPGSFDLSIRKFAPDGTRNTFGRVTEAAADIAFDASGNVYYSDYFGGVVVYTPASVIIKSFEDTIPGSTTSIAFDYAGNLYVIRETSIDSDTIYKVTPNDVVTVFATGGRFADFVGDRSGNMFVTEFVTGEVAKFAPDGTRTTFATGLNGPSGIALDPDGNVFVGDSDKLLKFTPTGEQSEFATGLGDGFSSLAFDTAGNLFVSELGSTHQILKFTPDGSQSVFSTDGGTGAIAFEPALYHLLNISCRGLVQTGNNVLIGGFIVGGNGLVDGKVILRGIGPSLSSLGGDALGDPVLELHDSAGALIATNDNWKDSQQAEIEATGLAPTDDRDSAIVARLPAGSYTAIVRGANSSAGVGLVEVYNLN